MTLTADDGRTFTSATEPSTPRLRLRPDAATERLDGAWWPRSTDLAEAALKLAATNGNHTHAQDLVASAGTTRKTAPEDI